MSLSGQSTPAPNPTSPTLAESAAEASNSAGFSSNEQQSQPVHVAHETASFEDGSLAEEDSDGALLDSASRPSPPARGHSYAVPNSNHITSSLDPFAADRQRRVSYPASSVLMGFSSSTATTPLDDKDIWGSAGRTARAASDGLLLANGFGLGGRSREKSESEVSATSPLSSGAKSSSLSTSQEHQDQAAFFRAHERRSLETSAQARLSNTASSNSLNPSTGATTHPSASFSAELDRDSLISPPLPSAGSAHGSSFFQQQARSTSNLPLLSPTGQPGSAFEFKPSSQLASQQQSSNDGSAPNGAKSPEAIAAAARATSASLHLGDLDVWMDEAYVRECCTRMGWDGVTNIKMIRGASPSSGYCFLTFPSAAHAAQILARFNAAPPTLMPRSSRTFKLNWGTGLPGLQPRWDGEYSVFVGDLGREVGEADLVALFTPLFPSTKSAKVMCDPSTGLSRGYGFVRFADENDMERALSLGQNAGSGLSLHGRTLRISEASGPNNDKDRASRAKSGPNGDYSQQSTGRSEGATGSYPEFLSSAQASPFIPSGPLSPGTAAGTGGYTSSPAFNGSSNTSGGMSRTGPLSPAFLNSAPSRDSSHSSDPNNTTVFVGGLPACISEETLKSFFHHFGEITYCKIPTGKGCGFVQFVRRADAELAIAKMNDFPIHGKSRIRLSWGRSQGDKQVEHVRKLASALGVPFEAVWRMVQGQDNTTIKQIATAVNGNGSSSSTSHPATYQGSNTAQSQSDAAAQASARFSSMGVGRMDLGAVASAAGLSEAEVLDLVGGRSQNAAPSSAATEQSGSSDFFSRSSHSHSTDSSSQLGGHQQHGPNGGNPGAGPYSRVSPSSFSAFSANNGMPLSPPPSAGSAYAMSGHMQYQQQSHHLPGSAYGMPAPYNSIRPDSYVMHSPASPYERVDFGGEGVVPMMPSQHQYHQGGMLRGNDRYMPPGSALTGGAGYDRYGPGFDAYGPMGPVPLEDAFANMSFGQGGAAVTSRLAPPVPLPHQQHQASFASAAHEFFPASNGAQQQTPPAPQQGEGSNDDSERLFYGGGGVDGIPVGEPHWGGWNGGVRA